MTTDNKSVMFCVSETVKKKKSNTFLSVNLKISVWGLYRIYFFVCYFSATPNGCTLKFNILHLQNGVYRTIGRMLSTIIVQGGEAPAFLSPHVVDYIVSGDILQVHLTPDDIGDPELRENLKKVNCNIITRIL